MPETPSLDRALKWLDDKGVGPAAAHRGGPSRRNPISKSRGAKSKAQPPSVFRHNRKCAVCRHPERNEIEKEFLRWRSPERIAKDFGIANHSSIYRHAHATGLFAQRATHLKLSLAPLIERAVTVPVTADSVVRAIIAFAHIDDEGKWVNPPKHVIHESRGNASSPPVGAQHAAPSERKAKVNRKTVSSTK